MIAFRPAEAVRAFDKVIENAVKRDRVFVLVALAVVFALSWGYVLDGAGMNMTAPEMTRLASSAGMAKMMPTVWDIDYATLMFFKAYDGKLSV